MPQLPDLIVEFARLVRFGIVGVIATLVYFSTTFVAIEAFALTPVRASIVGQVTAMGVSYFGHSLFSFAVKTDHRTYLWRFLVIAALTFTMNGVVTWLLTDVLRVYYPIAVGIVGLLIPLTNYVCNRFWVFMPGLRDSRSTLDPSAPPPNVGRT